MFLNPQKIVEFNIQILPGMKVVDFGCGRGDFALYAARSAGIFGKVYAVDIKKEALEVLKNAARRLNLNNIETIRANAEKPFSTALKENSIQCIILSNILHSVENKENLLAEIKRILESDGKVYVIDWEKNNKKFGPEGGKRLSREETKNLFEQNGFKYEKIFSAGEAHYGI